MLFVHSYLLRHLSSGSHNKRQGDSKRQAVAKPLSAFWKLREFVNKLHELVDNKNTANKQLRPGHHTRKGYSPGVQPNFKEKLSSIEQPASRTAACQQEARPTTSTHAVSHLRMDRNMGPQ